MTFKRPATSGFTLIRMTAALVLASALTALSMPLLRDAQGRASTATPVDALVSDLRHAGAEVRRRALPSSECQSESESSCPATPSLRASGLMPGTGRVFYVGEWHTWLASSAGTDGGRFPVTERTAIAPGSFFILDITSAASPPAEAETANLVVGEWTSSTLHCVMNAACGRSLGQVSGTPLMRQLRSGHWAVLFGNGLHSATGTAGLFILLIDPVSGAKIMRFLDTGWGPDRDPLEAKGRNGMARIATAEFDNDQRLAAVHGVDAFGNVWRFDLTSDDPSRWKAPVAPL